MSQSYAKSPAAERRFTTKEMVLVGMFAAVLAVISQISLPMPTGVPITIQVFGVALVGASLGSRLGTTATLVYVLLGAIGLPIFANFSGGVSSIVGVTGGYIWAWPIMAWLCGIRPKTENKTKNLVISIIFALIGLLIVETIGGLQWHFVGGSMSIPAIAVYSLTAFIPKDIIITVLAVLIAVPIRKGINNAEIVKIHGIGLDKAGRCTHYHTELDVAALLCGKCRKYYACYECHDEMEDHSFEATSEAEPWPVLCGCCRNKLSREEYKTGSCPYCHAQFNPGCSLHENIYFCK